MTVLRLSSPSPDHHQGPAELLFRLVLGQLVTAGVVDRIVECRATARAQPSDTIRELLDVVAVVDNQFRSRVEAHKEGTVVLLGQDALQEFDRRFLLELEPGANGVAGVENHPDPQRQVAFPIELADFLLPAVIEDLEVLSAQIRDEAILPVGDREQQRDSSDVDLDDVGIRVLVDGFELSLAAFLRPRCHGQHGSRRQGGETLRHSCIIVRASRDRP